MSERRFRLGRQKLWGLVRGPRVLEVGVGTGKNMPTCFIAILAGLLSFLSPCVLPLVPAYLGYLGGRSAEELAPA